MRTTAIAQTDVVILAGGKGTRLRPLTSVFPKPLVPLGDKPVLEILLRRLKQMDFTRVTLCTGHMEELLRAIVGDGSRYGLKVSYSHENQPLGTAGPLANLSSLSDPFLVMNGDLLTTLDFRGMLDWHNRHLADATIAVFQRDINIDFGVIETDGNSGFLNYREKPRYRMDVSMGINILGRRLIESMTPGEPMDMPQLILNAHQRGLSVRCYREDCYWLDIGRMDDYALAQDEFAQNRRLFLLEDQ